jgi:hypothetical protein
MALQQLAFGGVSRISYCSRCNKPLSNHVSVEAGMGPICRGHGGKDMGTCKREDFADADVIGEYSDVFLEEALVLQRDGNDDHAIVRTNVPHLVVHHSPSGYEWGYAGSGPADLALNVCQWYLESIHYKGEKTTCFDGNCWSLAWVLHQEFKRTFIAGAPHQGAVIPMTEIKAWFEAHITDELKKTYASLNQEELE